MAPPSQNLVTSLEFLKPLQDQGMAAIPSSRLTRTHRERLVRNGFLREVVKGWYIITRPDDRPGDSTAWFASFWSFCTGYLNARFGSDWCVGPERSLSLLTGDWTVPPQLLVRAPAGGNKPLALPFQTSMFDLRLALPAERDRRIENGVRMFSLPAALIAVSAPFFSQEPIIARAALAAIGDASEILADLLENGRSTVAGRLAGALRNIGRNNIADDIMAAMRTAGYSVSEANPFQGLPDLTADLGVASPHVNRQTMNWQRMRTDILKWFPPAPAEMPDISTYMQQVEDAYVVDAYNSLSIEGYRVTEGLIERVRAGDWNPDAVAADRDRRNAMAARGYWQAFQRVKQSLVRVLNLENSGVVARNDHASWYRELFGPSITAGIVRPSDLAGYRSGSVFIRGSAYMPPACEAVRELMPAFFDLLESETEPAVRVVLGHFVFVHIHPYFDGNGRMGRFLMNVMMASAGYPWTVVPVARRDDYMAALERASAAGDIVPFTRFLGSLIP